MSKLELVKIDSRGRIVLPQSFRDYLGLREEDTAYAVLDEENRCLRISPAAEENLVHIELILGDAPGSLAKAAAILSKEGVDLVATESHSVARGKQAIWRIVAKSGKSVAELKKSLQLKGLKIKSLRKL
ncbi:hypothetical protein HZC09_03625 [Candidatus Micrarchaeota archaeon]|nr:hypothetical protein [Candidatus Micrarchaeota archaeon]